MSSEDIRTASDIRKLMPKPMSQVLDDITERCAESAKKGNDTIRITDYDFGNAYELSTYQCDIIDELRDLGFNVEHVCETKQFVNMYLRVDWKE